MIELVGRAQEPDGYLNTYFTVNAPERKWKNLIEGHESLPVRTFVSALLCCIPVVTIPAALCAQNAYLGKMFRNGYGFDFSDYWKEFKSSLWKLPPEPSAWHRHRCDTGYHNNNRMVFCTGFYVGTFGKTASS